MQSHNCLFSEFEDAGVPRQSFCTEYAATIYDPSFVHPGGVLQTRSGDAADKDAIR